MNRDTGHTLKVFLYPILVHALWQDDYPALDVP